MTNLQNVRESRCVCGEAALPQAPRSLDRREVDCLGCRRWGRRHGWYRGVGVLGGVALVCLIAVLAVVQLDANGLRSQVGAVACDASLVPSARSVQLTRQASTLKVFVEVPPHALPGDVSTIRRRRAAGYAKQARKSSPVSSGKSRRIS